MTEQLLNGCRILVVEDEYLLADELDTTLAKAGAEVIGPVAAIDEALALIDAEPRIDGALLDANVRGKMIFPVADRLIARGVPFVFTTGYDAAALPSRFKKIRRCEKPVNLNAVAREIGDAIHAAKA